MAAFYIENIILKFYIYLFLLQSLHLNHFLFSFKCLQRFHFSSPKFVFSLFPFYCSKFLKELNTFLLSLKLCCYFCYCVCLFVSLVLYIFLVLIIIFLLSLDRAVKRNISFSCYCTCLIFFCLCSSIMSAHVFFRSLCC